MNRSLYGLMGLFGLCLVGYYYVKVYPTVPRRPHISTLDQISSLFPRTKKAVEELVSTSQKNATLQLEALYAMSDAQRTYENSIVYIDKVFELLKIANTALYVLSLASVDKEIREAAQKGSAELQAMGVDLFSMNQRLFDVVLAYEKRVKKEGITLLPEQSYFLEEMLKEFRRNGLQLPQEERDRVRNIKKELSQLVINFDTIASAARGEVTLSREELAGLEDSFIDSLTRTADGRYSVTTDYTHFFKVLEQADVTETRKRLYRAFMQRGYPENEKILEKIIALSDELAQLLGYRSYAHYVLEDQMAKSPERVEQFLQVLYEKSYPKALKEMDELRTILPPSIILHEGKLQPWDLPWLYNFYKKKFLALDEVEVSDYFPLRSTLTALMKLYEEFFGLSFCKTEKIDLWSDDLESYAVYKKGRYIGTVILDLFPRPFKFSHAGQITVVPAVKDVTGKLFPAVVVLLANFTKEQPNSPSLLRRREVITFFHEFGHVIHALLGSTELASNSGTATKGDFVEMPSQMLEEWLWDPAILKSVSCHKGSKKPLPDELIKKIVALKYFDAGEAMLRQIYLAYISLAYYMAGANKNLQKLWKSYHEKYRPFMVFDEANKGYCAFCHITGYGPRYYGYLWSRIFALDLFSQIKSHGLRNPEIGSRYVQEVLSKGGSLDPEMLLMKFLGREPSPDAFFKDLGLA